ncbi:MAG: CoA ester lyase [Xanthobacteraceae bacterium]|nr:CoA ester lyase [Xanthobacteraceae bacterium]QYK43951.1 MAG: CoA ester lyase [Xanthobacteraceae bacterium]
MRSYLFVPGDSARKLEKGLASGADALLLDLEDAVALDNKAKAREVVRDYLNAHIKAEQRPRLFVRVNALDTGMTDADLDAVLPARPDGILFPKSRSGTDVAHLDAKITAREAMFGLPDGATKILVLVTESAQALFGLANYRGSSKRLAGMTWGGEDLSVDIGAETNRDERGEYTDPYRLARAQCLLAAVNADTPPIDSIYANFRNIEGLRKETLEGRRDGFTGKMAIHPDQVPVINEIYTPSAEAIAQAKRVVEAFATANNAGVISLDGAMLDQPHLKRAQRLLARVRK